MIVGGKVHFSGGRRDVAVAEIQRAASVPEPAALVAAASLEKDQAKVTATVTSTEGAAAQQSWRLMVALALKEARTDVRHGENAGEALTEAAIVRWLSAPTPISSAGGPIQIAVPKPRDVAWKDVELVAFVQAKTTGQVIAARTIAFKSP
jgi:hypothetical protein